MSLSAVVNARSVYHEEDALIRRVSAGDQDAFDILYSCYAPRLRLYLNRRCHDPALVDDVLNDVMLVLWQQAGRCPSDVPLAAWLYGIARHKVNKALARAASSDIPVDAPGQTSASPGPEDWMLDDEQHRTLARALNVLSPHDRRAVELLLYRGYSYQQIAEHMMMSVNTIKSRLRRAKHRLAVRVTEMEVLASRVGVSPEIV